MKKMSFSRHASHVIILTLAFVVSAILNFASAQYPVFQNTGNPRQDSLNYQSALQQYDNQKATALSAARLDKPVGKKDRARPTEMLTELGLTANSAAARTAAESCLIPTDASWSVLPGNDDGSTGLINLGFTFNLYGTNYNSVYINNNGNITFTNSFSGYTPSGFPMGTPMVSAFWDDIDTRTCGAVRYKLFGTRLVVSYEEVGQYSQNCGLRNTFQIVIGTLNDPLLGNGQNVKFFYGDMQWSKGASTVGINSGSNSDYVQVGRFGVQGSTAYDGGGGATDGVDYLDYQCFSFNVSNVGNQPPSLSGFPTGNTVSLGCGQTATYTIQSLPPEVNQSVTTTVNTNGMCGVTTSITNGAVSTVNISVTGSNCNAGTNVITFTSTDNGNPALTTTSTLTVIVGIPTPIITASGPTTFCEGGSVTLTSSSASSYLWSNGATSQSITVNQSGNYTVTTSGGPGCSVTSNPVSVTVHPNPPATITSGGPTTFCQGGSVALTASAGASYLWSTGATTQTINVSNPGNYTVTVTQANGCSDVSSATAVSVTGGPDSDGDGYVDACDADDDNDGITDFLECNSSNFYWSNPPTVSGNTATGVINGVSYTYTSSQPVLTTPNVFNHGIFPTSYNIPNIQCIQNINASNNTLTFSTPISNPVLVFASIGGGPISVPIEFSHPIDILWSTAVVKNSDTKLTGQEGYAIVRLNGVFSSISFNYLTTENYVNFLFGADFQSCGDTDGDSIPDYLDTDSDNDGCSDAIEGSQNPLASQITNGRLNGAIDANGVPVIVNGGQGIGTSKTSNVNCHCQPGIDRTAPVLTCSAKTLASCETVLPNFSSQITATDNCPGNFTYSQSPAAGTPIAPGATVTVTMTVTDAVGNSSTCSFTVTRPNETPVAVNDGGTVCPGASVSVDVLSNDSHPQGKTLTINDYTQPSVGTVTKVGNNLVYTAPAGYSGPVTFKYTVKASDATIAFSENGHYYEWVPSPNITWTNARAQAATKTYNGLQGYLVTVTSATEMAFVAAKLQGSGWMGASDLAYEGTWRWVTGPEGLENGGLGRHFSNQSKVGNCSANQGPAVGGYYNNWAGGEPNDCGANVNQYTPTDVNRGGEHYAHFYGGGIWNDYPNSVGNNSILGYIVEYGGLEGCIPVLTAEASVTINVKPTPVVTLNTTSINLCPGTTTTLTASGAASYQWSNGATTASITVGAGTYTVTGTTDGCSSAPVSATVTANDNVAPVPTVASLPTVTGQCAASVTAPTATDNCAGLITGTTNNPTSYTAQGTYTITWSFNDDNGNITTQNQTVVVDDNTPPVITLNANGALTGLGAVSTFHPTVPGSPNGSLSHAHGIAYDLQKNTVWVTDQDLSNDVVEFAATQPNGSTLPQLSRFDPGMPSTIEGIAFDPTDNTLWIVDFNGNVKHVTRTGTTLTGGFNAGLTIPVGTFGARGLGITIQNNFIWIDNGVRAYKFNKAGGSYTGFNFVTGQPGITYDPERNLLWSSGWNDNRYRAYNPSTGALVFTSAPMGLIQGHDLSIGAGKIWVASENGNPDKIYSIEINGGEVDEIVECHSTYNDPGYTVTDNCAPTPAVTVTSNVNTNVPGTYTITYSTTDVGGNTTVATRTVTVLDRLIPVPTVASLPTVTGECSATVTAPTANDACAGLITGTTNSPLTYTAQGTYTIVWKYDDGNGNITTQNQTVIVADITPPVITAPANITVKANSSCNATGVALGTAIASDNCPGVTVTNNAPGTFPLGSTTVTWTATDAVGRTTTATQIVTVKDSTGPSIVCPADITLECTESTAPSNTGSATATDNCDANPAISYTDQIIPGNCPGNYVIKRSWNATDASGNSSSGSGGFVQRTLNNPSQFSPTAQLITFENVVPGNIITNQYSSQGVTFSLTSGGGAGVIIDGTPKSFAPGGNTAVHNYPVGASQYGNMILSFSTPINRVGFEIRTNTGDDLNLTATYINNGTVVNTAFFTTDLNFRFVGLESSVAFDKVIIDVTNISNGAFNMDNLRFEGGGNGCVQTITVKDTKAPSLTIPADVTVQCNAIPTVGTATASDLCGTATVTYLGQTKQNGNCVSNYTLKRSWKATDQCGNSITKTQTITVIDTEAPTFTRPADVVLYKDAECSLDASPSGAAGDVTNESDNCSTGLNATYSDVVVNNCEGTYTITRTWSLVDNCGNAAANQVQTITVKDNTAPTFTRPADVVLYKDAECSVDASPSGAAGDVTDESDNCSTGLNATYSDVVVNNCEGTYTITRTWSLVDNCGNAAANQVQTITVKDNTAPTFTRPADVVLYKDAECSVDASPSGAAGDVTDESDNCSTGLNATYSDVVVNNCEGTYTITRTWSLVDNCGNAAANQVQTITVKDNTAPTFTRPADITIYTDANCNYDASLAQTGDVTDEGDNCSTGIQATYSDVVTAGACEGTHIIKRTWSLVDNCGNAAASQVQTITVSDNIAPIVTYNVGSVFHCFDTTGNNYAVAPITATDNCSSSLTYAYTVYAQNGSQIRTGTTNNASGAFQVGTNSVNWTITDKCGNQSTATTLVTINPPITGSINGFTVLPQGVQSNTLYLGYTPASTAVIKITAGGGTAPYTYSWSTTAPAGSFVPVAGDPSSIKIIAVTAGIFTYTATVTDAKGCVAQFVKIVRVVDVRCGNKMDKVLVCHKTGSASNPWVQICIAPAAVATHLGNGSYLGVCESQAVTQTTKPAVIDDAKPQVVVAYPNPNRGQFALQLKDFNSGKVQVQIVDMLGRTVESREVSVSNPIELVNFNLLKPAAGVYQARVVSADGVSTAQVVIAR